MHQILAQRLQHLVIDPLHTYIWSSCLLERILVMLTFSMALWILNPATQALADTPYVTLIQYGISEGVWGWIFLIKSIVHTTVITQNERWLRRGLCFGSIILWGFILVSTLIGKPSSPTVVLASTPIIIAVIALLRLLYPNPKEYTNVSDTGQ